MNSLKLGLATAMLVISAGQTAQAATVVFDLRDTSFNFGGGTLEQLDDSPNLTLINSGITANLSAAVVGSTGEFNQTGSGFGINADPSGDVTNQIDGAAGIESVTISFTTDVRVEAISVSSVGNDDEASLSFSSGNGPIAINSTGSTNTDSVLLSVGQSFTFTHVNGNGISFDSFTVSAVPEPSSLALLGLGGLLVARRRRG